MSRETARIIAKQKLQGFRQLPYHELAKSVGRNRTVEVNGPDGLKYQIEVQAYWDSKKGGDVRVIVAVDGGEVSAFRPLTVIDIPHISGVFAVPGTSWPLRRLYSPPRHWKLFFPKLASQKRNAMASQTGSSHIFPRNV